jgi:hypothetical protein
MNADQLSSKYKDGIPESLQEGLLAFQHFAARKNVVSVTILPNFGKDHDMSLKYNTNIWKGVVVRVSDKYELSDYDRLWLHPDISKGRSLYKPSKTALTTELSSDLDEFGSTVSTYSTHSIDEIGGYKTEQFGIIDNGKLEESETMLNSWILARQTIATAYSEVSKLYKVSKDSRNKLAQNVFGTAKPLHNSDYVMLYSDASTYYFYNHAIKPKGNQALVHISPLMGYALLEDVQSTEIESDYFSGSYIDVNKLQGEQRDRAFVKCKWAGGSLVNTYTMTKPLSFYKDTLEQHPSTMYRMESGIFSHNPIQEKLDMDLILYLTPKSENIPSNVQCAAKYRDDIFEVPHSHDLLASILKNNWKTMIKPEYMSGNSLVVPRGMLDKN